MVYFVYMLFNLSLCAVVQDVYSVHTYQVRIHSTLESLYKWIPMELLPDEYLPDDHTGPSAGPLQKIIGEICTWNGIHTV